MRIDTPKMHAPKFWSENGSIGMKLMAVVGTLALLQATGITSVAAARREAAEVKTAVVEKAHKLKRDMFPTKRFMGAQVGDTVQISFSKSATIFGKAQVVDVTDNSITILDPQGNRVTAGMDDIASLKQHAPAPAYVYVAPEPPKPELKPDFSNPESMPHLTSLRKMLGLGTGGVPNSLDVASKEDQAFIEKFAGKIEKGIDRDLFASQGPDL